MSRIFFTSDLHLGHRNIVKGVTNWEIKFDFQCRPFNSVEEHDSYIINKINEIVHQDDTLYILGDFAFGSVRQIKDYRKRIICRNIHYVMGNHDKEIRKNRGGLQGIFTTCDERKTIHLQHPSPEVKKGITVILDHYAGRTWNGIHKGYFQLHGHSHSYLEQHESMSDVDKQFMNYKTMDVGIDNANRLLGEYRPFNWKYIARRLYKRNIFDRRNRK